MEAMVSLSSHDFSVAAFFSFSYALAVIWLMLKKVVFTLQSPPKSQKFLYILSSRMWEEILMGLGLQSQEEKEMAPMSFFLKECLQGFKKKIKL